MSTSASFPRRNSTYNFISFSQKHRRECQKNSRKSWLSSYFYSKCRPGSLGYLCLEFMAINLQHEETVDFTLVDADVFLRANKPNHPQSKHFLDSRASIFSLCLSMVLFVSHMLFLELPLTSVIICSSAALCGSFLWTQIKITCANCETACITYCHLHM